MKNKVQDELKQHFRPEFLNRVDDVVVFPQLSQEDILRIVDLMIDKVDERLKDRDMGIELSQSAKELLSQKGYDPVLGARPLRRTIQREVEDTLSEKILFGELRPGHIVVVDTEGEGDAKTFTFRGEEKSALPDVPPIEQAAGGAGPNLEQGGVALRGEPGRGCFGTSVPGRPLLLAASAASVQEDLRVGERGRRAGRCPRRHRGRR